jgi:hypothetical protein
VSKAVGAYANRVKTRKTEKRLPPALRIQLFKRQAMRLRGASKNHLKMGNPLRSALPITLTHQTLLKITFSVPSRHHTDKPQKKKAVDESTA